MECPVCFSRYTAEAGAHLPKVFPCGHTACTTCVGQLGSSFGGRVACPMCRVKAQAREVQTNFALRDAAVASADGRSPAVEPPQQQAMAPSNLQALYGTPLLAASASALPVPSAPPAEPWQVGPQNMYEQAGDTAQSGTTYPAPAHENTEERAWMDERRRTLREWGRKRERKVHRSPSCLMDQMVSGSGLFPPRLLDGNWFTDRETSMIRQLESLLEGTGNSHALARDMLAPILYGIDVRIILDNSGSMQLDMLGNDPPRNGPQRGFSMFGTGAGDFNIEDTSPASSQMLERALRDALPAPWFSSGSQSQNFRPAVGGLSPFGRRWKLARDALRQWMRVYGVLGIDPLLYLLNPVPGIGSKCRGSALEQVFAKPPQGTTPMTEAIYAALEDHRREAGSGSGGGPLQLLVLTDGEADNMRSFGRCLDEVQNGRHGDVQVCLMGLSLVKRDIEWFEDEECCETRIRTVEPFEVEQRQIQMKEVVRREGAYNFAMHTNRVLVTNFFPADYDYEAPLQNLRHRIYITLHGRDRWWSLGNPIYYAGSQVVCSACFLATACHCFGWCQGHDCGKCHRPELLEALEEMCGEE